MGTKNIQAYLAILLMAAFTTPSTVFARPVSFPDGWMLMQTNDGTTNAGMISYSPTAYDAFGVRTEYFRQDETLMHTMTYNRLLKRWNNATSQGNFYIMTGIGMADDHSSIAPAGFGGIEGDWESRRYYVSYENRFIASSKTEQNFDQKARLGIAPYLNSYASFHPWLMVEFEHNPNADKKFTVTPLIRLFNTGFLTEIGYSSNKTLLLNATYQF